MGWYSKEYIEEKAKAEKLEKFLEKYQVKGYMQKDESFLIISFTYEKMQSIKGSLTIEICYYVQKPLIDYAFFYKNGRHKEGGTAGTFEGLTETSEPLKRLISELQRKEMMAKMGSQEKTIKEG